MARFSFEGFGMEGISEKDIEKVATNKVLTNYSSNNDDKEVCPEDFERKSEVVIKANEREITEDDFALPSNYVKVEKVEREITEEDFAFDANILSVKKDEDQDEFINFDC
jgi:hypothetical protein